MRVLPLAAVNHTEWVLILIGFAAMGGPSALVAWFRGRSAVGWFLISFLVALVGMAVFPAESRSSPLVVFPILLLTPSVLLVIPKGPQARRLWRRRAPEEPADWSSRALEAESPPRKREP